MKQLCCILLFSVFSCALNAQGGGLTEKMALSFFEAGDYEKANEYYSELYLQSPIAWYEQYYASLIGAKDYVKAEKITRKLLKQDKNAVHLYIKLANLSSIQNDEKKAKEYKDKALKDLPATMFHIEKLAETFKFYNQYDYAISTYNKGKKLMPDYGFFYERAEVYKLQNDLQHMIEEYLDALDFRDSELQNVQTQLQNSLGYDDVNGGINNPLLRQELQRRIQKNPNKEVFAEFLIFILQQQRDFEGAFIQTKALDKRKNESGQRVMSLASIIKANSQWELATRCYQYVLDKGSASPYSMMAGLEILDVEYKALTSQANPDKTALLELEKKLEKGRTTYQRNAESVSIVKNTASLKAYYLDKVEEAVTLLQEAIETPGIVPIIQAEYKIMLGDIYLLNGQIWDASLLYSQVEKTFKFEAIGNEAKFRNAKLSYYAGDFLWAKAQADILKGATAKLIANDALDLSLVISDAIGVDTNEVPLQMFSSAELLTRQHKYPMAIARMDSINSIFNSHTLGDDINYKKAQIFEAQGKWNEAEEMYKSIVEYYSSEIYGDDAMFKLAELYEFKLKDTEKAKKTYEDLIIKFPGSVYTVESRKRFRQLRGDAINN